jgi:putative ABC transport system substrate-binding protein
MGIFAGRNFIALLGGAAAWPLAARAQQPAMPVIGYLSARSPDDTWHLVEAFRRGLREAGFVEGQNATIEYRWALGEHERLAGLASDLVRKPVSVLVTTGGESAERASPGAESSCNATVFEPPPARGTRLRARLMSRRSWRPCRTR